MTLKVDLDDEIMKSDKTLYKLRSVYEKNNMVHVKFETKFGLHRGTFKKNKLYINPATNREYLYDEIDKAVRNLFDNDSNKKYSSGFSKNIDKVIETKEKEKPMSEELVETVVKKEAVHIVGKTNE